VPDKTVSEVSDQLVEALRERDEARRLLSSVEQLQIGGAVTEEHRDAARADYQQRLSGAEERVELAREEVARRGRAISTELEGLRRQESALEVRYKVGEFNLDQYQEASASLKRKERTLESELSALKKLYKADTVAEAETSMAAVQTGAPSPAQKARQPVAQTRPSVTRTRPAIRQEARGGIIGWLTEGAHLRLLSAGLVVAGAAVIVLLFAQVGINATGGFTLPGLPNPFAGNDDVAQESVLPGQSGLDEQTPPTNGAGTSAPVVGGVAQVPLTVQGGAAVGSLHVELVYDATLLEVVSVQWGQLPVDALFEYAARPGNVTLGMVAPSGLGTNLTVAVVTLEAVQSSSGEQTPLYLENVTAHNSDSLVEMVASVVAGSIDLTNGTVMAPAMVFGG
jgi:hypothetical protein